MTLKDLRIQSGLKAIKVSEQLGVTPTTLYRIEIAKSKINKLKVEKLASIYGYSHKQIEEAWEENNEKNNSGRIED